MALFRLLLASLISVYEVDFTAATPSSRSCTGEQLEWCRRTGGAEQVDYCVERPYQQFTHVCVVRAEWPAYDACCCRVPSDALLCCRHRFNSGNYYCVDSKEVIAADDYMFSPLMMIVLLGICLLLFGIVAVVVVILCSRRRVSVSGDDVIPADRVVSRTSGLKSSSGDVDQRAGETEDARVELLHTTSSSSSSSALSASCQPTAPPTVPTVEDFQVHPPAPVLEDHVPSPSCQHCQCYCQHGEPPPSYTDSQRDHAFSTQLYVTSQHVSDD